MAEELTTAGARGTQSTHRSCGAWQQTEGTKKAQTEKRGGEREKKEERAQAEVVGKYVLRPARSSTKFDAIPSL
jgi:hypothetical protein